MSGIKYREPADVDYGDYSPEGEAINGFVTKPVSTDDTFGEAVRQLVLQATDRTYGLPSILMTTRSHWSGYSEYTVTNQWSEIILTVPDWNWEREWPSLGEFLRALAEANPAADRYAGQA